MKDIQKNNTFTLTSLNKLTARPSYTPEKIQRLMSKLNLNERGLAIILNVSPYTIRLWLKGKMIPYDGRSLTHPEFHICAHPCAINIAARQFMEDEQWRAGYAALEACKEAFLMNDDLERSYYDFLDDSTPRELEAVVMEHGIENARQVLALTINSFDEKFALSLEPDVLAWAKATTPFQQPPNPNSEQRKYTELTLDTLHPVIINMAARDVMLLETMQKPPVQPKRGGDAR